MAWCQLSLLPSFAADVQPYQTHLFTSKTPLVKSSWVAHGPLVANCANCKGGASILIRDDSEAASFSFRLLGPPLRVTPNPNPTKPQPEP